MATDFDAIWDALRERLANGTDGFRTVTRSPRDQWGIEQHPVLEIVEKDEVPGNEVPQPVYTLTGVLGIAVRVNGDEGPMPKLNALIRSVRTALERQPSDSDAAGEFYGVTQHWTNLDGRVLSLSVGGVEKTLGETSGEAWARIELEMQAL